MSTSSRTAESSLELREPTTPRASPATALSTTATHHEGKRLQGRLPQVRQQHPGEQCAAEESETKPSENRHDPHDKGDDHRCGNQRHGLEEPVENSRELGGERLVEPRATRHELFVLTLEPRAHMHPECTGKHRLSCEQTRDQSRQENGRKNGPLLRTRPGAPPAPSADGAASIRGAIGGRVRGAIGRRVRGAIGRRGHWCCCSVGFVSHVVHSSMSRRCWPR